MLIRRHCLHCLSAFKRKSELENKPIVDLVFSLPKENNWSSFWLQSCSPLLCRGNETDEKKVLAFDMNATLSSCSWLVHTLLPRKVYLLLLLWYIKSIGVIRWFHLVISIYLCTVNATYNPSLRVRQAPKIYSQPWWIDLITDSM